MTSSSASLKILAVQIAAKLFHTLFITCFSKMSSGFVSGGTANELIERDDEWLKAQQELEATRRRKEEESRQSGGKSLYEVLQQKKGRSTVLTVTL